MDYMITASLMAILGGVILYKNKKENDLNKFFNKEYGEVLKGACCIIVIMVHVLPQFQNKLQDAVGSFAYVCVTIFFLASAYGMQYSYEKKADYLKHFWRNRLAALLVPCVVLNLISSGYKLCIGQDFTWTWLTHINHYVTVLLEYCLWWYLVTCVSRRLKWSKRMADLLLIAGVTLSSLLMYLATDVEVSADSGWCFERMGLVWGLLLYRYYGSFIQWMNKRRLKKFILFCLLSLVLGCAYLKFKPVYFYGEYLLKIALGVAIITFLFVCSSNRRFGNKAANYLGNISYEVYLSHGFIMGVIAHWTHPSSGIFIALTIFGTIVFAGITHALAKPIIKKLRR